MRYVIVLVITSLLSGCYSNRESCKNKSPKPYAPPGHRCDQFLF